ncbi:MAG TPA: hypothetical protein VJR27_01970 [Candidatus Saccharimonadales bacterium]|nr:hypothetical protein [Candidatus Saccharimonadales bacterium]
MSHSLEAVTGETARVYFMQAAELAETQVVERATIAANRASIATLTDDPILEFNSPVQVEEGREPFTQYYRYVEKLELGCHPSLAPEELRAFGALVGKFTDFPIHNARVSLLQKRNFGFIRYFGVTAACDAQNAHQIHSYRRNVENFTALVEAKPLHYQVPVLGEFVANVQPYPSVEERYY